MPNTRQQLKDYCLRQLGHPVIEINVDEDQVEERIDDAIQFWHEYHFDGIERTYMLAQIEATKLVLATADAEMFEDRETVTGQTSGATATVYRRQGTELQVFDTEGTFADGETIVGSSSAASVVLAASDAFTLGNWDRRYITVDDSVTGVVRLLTIGPGTSGVSPRNIFDVIYQFRLQDMYNLMSTDLVYYAQVKQHLQMFDMLFPGDRTITFNRKQGRIHIEFNWREVVRPGDYIVAEVFRIIDPTQFPKVYNDIFIKRYATALIKRQWGSNMKKFGGLQLPGGVTLNGKEIYDEAEEEIRLIQSDMQSRYEEPPIFMVG